MVEHDFFRYGKMVEFIFSITLRLYGILFFFLGILEVNKDS